MPRHSLLLAMLLFGLHVWSVVFECFSYKTLAFSDGQWWRIFSAQLVHFDSEHLLLNILTLLLLGYFYEREYRVSLYLILLYGACAVALQLPFSGLDNYCGISGALNALIFPVAWALWLSTRRLLIWFFVALHFSRLLMELLMGVSIATDLEWPSYPPSHLIGFCAGVLWVLSAYLFGFSSIKPICRGEVKD